MKKIFFIATVTFIIFPLKIQAQSQWTETGNNHTMGKLGLGTSSPNKDIEISRSNSLAGIDIYNTNASGRSTVLVGEGNSGRYIYLGYQNSSHVSGLGAFKPASGIIYTGAPNGMSLISSNYLSFTVGGLEDSHERLRITNSGDIGIGTSSPSTKLHVSSAEEDVTLFKGSNTTGLLADRFNRVILRNLNGQQSWIGIEGSGSNARGYLGIEHWQDTSPKIVMTWNKDGKVGIGTSSPDMKLTVKGNIHAEEVKIDLSVPAPDYVFKEDYNLRSIEEVENFIKENNHLPEIPSAKEFEKNGVMQAEMDMSLLKKIEELTLYTIDQEKRLKNQDLKIKKLEEENQELKSLSDRLSKIEKLLKTKK